MTKPTCYEYELMQGKISNTVVWEEVPARTIVDKKKKHYYSSLFSRLEEKMVNADFDSPNV